jgi:hypothetical protein
VSLGEFSSGETGGHLLLGRGEMKECGFVGDYAIPVSKKGKEVFKNGGFIINSPFKEDAYPFALNLLLAFVNPFGHLGLKKDKDYKILQVLPVERGA